MKKQFMLFAVLGLFLFPSCEKEALEPEVDATVNLNAVAEAHQNKPVLNFRAHLTGDQEVPPVETQATGQTIFKLSKDGSELSYKLIVANIEDVLMAHIHLAPAGENGGVVAWLYPDGPPPVQIPGTFNGILAEGVITSADLQGSLAGLTLQDLVDEMIDGMTYVNVHTLENGSGEIRGQISANNVK